MPTFKNPFSSNTIFNAKEFYDMYFSSDEEMEDDLFPDDDELDIVKEPHYRTTNAYHSHKDRLKSHIFSTYLSPEAIINGVSDKETYLGKKFRP